MSLSRRSRPSPEAPPPPTHEKTIIAIDTRDGVSIGRIMCPSIGQREAPIIQTDATEAAATTEHRLILDFTQVTMMGSMALGTLVTLTKAMRQAGGGLALFGLNANLEDVLRMSRLDKLLTISKDEQAAMRKVR